MDETSNLRVLLVSTSYPQGPEDWKGRFIADMVTALAKRQDLALSVWAPPGDLPATATDAAAASDRIWLAGLLARGGIAAALRGRKRDAAGTAFGLLRRLYALYRREPCDVVHVNWLQNALPLWGGRTPALVTVLGSDYGLLRQPGMAAMLRAVFRQRPVVLAPNAAWMQPRLETLFGEVARIQPVPFGVDRPWFEVDRSLAGPGAWLAITRITRNKVGDLFNWGEGLFDEQRWLHLFGPMQEQMALPSWVTWHGPTHPAELQKNWFPRATGLITLSRHDEGRPQVMLEAMAAGLPVIASDLTAHRDFLRQGTTGWLVSDKQDFATTLKRMEEMDSNRRIGEAARQWIKTEIGDWDDCAGRYHALYRELCAA
jgi:hypothetical protein